MSSVAGTARDGVRTAVDMSSVAGTARDGVRTAVDMFSKVIKPYFRLLSNTTRQWSV